MNTFKIIRAIACGVFSISVQAAIAQPKGANEICQGLYEGVGYSAPPGTTVPAADDGVVVSVSRLTRFGAYAACDQHIVVLHQKADGRSVYTRYGEITTTLKVGVNVKRGDGVGNVGTRGEFFFETRPILATIDQARPSWSAVTSSDPRKFNFQTYESSDIVGTKPSSWARYQKAAIEEITQKSLAMFSDGQGGTKVFPSPLPYRFEVEMLADPFVCDTQVLRQLLATVGLNPPKPINYCVDLRSGSGQVARAYVQDLVAFHMAREIAIGEKLEVFAIHLYTNSSTGQNVVSAFQSSPLGLIVNEFNVLP